MASVQNSSKLLIKLCLIAIFQLQMTVILKMPKNHIVIGQARRHGPHGSSECQGESMDRIQMEITQKMEVRKRIFFITVEQIYC